MTVTEQLVDLLARPIADADRARAALLLLDWTGCAAAGQTEAAGQKVTQAFSNEAGNCTRIGAGKSSVLMAALHNGCLGNVLEMDDVDKRAVLHAAPTVIPAALAMAEHVGASSADFLNAIVIGYEATIRIGRAVGAGHYAYWHNTATCGPFGAAAAACHLLGGSDLVSAFGLAGTQAAGLWQTRHEPDSMAKQLHAGHAAHAGVLAAILSTQGFQGPRAILEGEQGFFKAMCPGANAQDTLQDFGQGWLIHQTSLKPYPACRHAHAAIDAALMAHKEMRAEETRPESTIPYEFDILVETYDDALKFCDNANPRSAIEAKFSLQHSVAVALIKGAPQLSDFEMPHADKRITALRARISVKSEEAFNVAYPHHYGTAITLGANRYTAVDAYGDPEKPMKTEAVLNKARMLMQHAGLSEAQSDTLAQAAIEGHLPQYLKALP